MPFDIYAAAHGTADCATQSTQEYTKLSDKPTTETSGSTGMLSKTAGGTLTESRPAPAQPQPRANGYWWGTGRRKTAVARVRLRHGKGQFLIDHREVKDYFFSDETRGDAAAPLRATKSVDKFDVFVSVHGGGQTGQSQAISLGIARALMKADPTLEQVLRDGQFLTRDARKVERKKPGQPGARKRFQFSKR
jgi:small subunit ribosomal protein S9